MPGRVPDQFNVRFFDFIQSKHFRLHIRRDLTASGAGTTYNSADAAVVTVTPDGLMAPQGPGETIVTASNRVIASVRVIVDLLSVHAAGAPAVALG